jgi:vesicle-fusing ATPase
MSYSISQLLDKSFSLTNCVFFSSKCDNIPLYIRFENYILKTNKYIDSENINPKEIGVNPLIRKLCKLALKDQIVIKVYPFTNDIVNSVSVCIKKDKVSNINVKFDETLLVYQILEVLYNHIPTIGMQYYIEINEVYQIHILNVSNIGIVTKDTKIEFQQCDGNINIENPTKSLNLFKKSINIQELGIGGLTDEFLIIFRKVFSSRLLPKKIKDELGINHVRGMLLYGPPGCGKTALARQLGKLLNCIEPKIVNGPSLLSKYVGESEENTRNLFAEAIEDQKKGKENLHLIICDEFDTIGKKRGSRTNDTGVSDQIVNTFLTMIDGVNSLNNILLICMTNRRDMIDEALLRSGRLEVQIEIKLPTKEGRYEILKIHTNKMKESKRIDSQIDLEEIANLTPNYSGAELEGLIRNATAYAISRDINMDAIKDNKQEKINPIIIKEDFTRALKEIKPNLGVINEIYSSIINRLNPEYNDYFKKNTDIFTNNNIILKTGSVTSVLIIGDPKTYKTYLSCYFAKMSNMSQIQMITTMNFNFSKSDIIDSYDKCKVTHNSCLIFDDMEGIISWNNIHNTYDNSIYQLIRNSCKTFLKEECVMLVIANCNKNNMLDLMELNKIFDHCIYIK